MQGFCVKDNGSIVLSTSSGVNSSNFYEYDSSKITVLEGFLWMGIIKRDIMFKIRFPEGFGMKI